MELNLTGTLAEMVKEYSEVTKTSFEEIGKAVKLSRTTISKYCSGTYGSDPSKVEKALAEYLEEMTGQEICSVAKEKSVKIGKKRSFFESKDAKNVLGVCSSCQEFSGLGIVVGKSGFGKTYALKYYAKMPKVAYIECDAVMSAGDLIESIEDALGLPTRHASARKRMKWISEFCSVNTGYLIIIDEADKLISKYSQNKMEIVRWIFDQSNVGIVVAGEPKLEVLLKNYTTCFANRVDFYAMLSGLDKKEVEGFLEDYEIEEEALLELRMRACNKNNGCFRLFDRTLNNVFRILNERGETKITLQIITQASDMMML